MATSSDLVTDQGFPLRRFAEDQKRRDKDTQVKVDKLRDILAKKLLEARGDEEACAAALLDQLEEKRDLSRVITLVDADAFYAACHQLEDPSLAGTAFGVGGGMLTTASYEGEEGALVLFGDHWRLTRPETARKYGCRSAMPLFLAKLLCPHIKSLSLKPELYTRASKAIFAILEKYGQIAPASLDEACKQVSLRLVRPFVAHKS
jgi:hypothetical protein